MKILIYLGAGTNKLREILAVCLGSVFILEGLRCQVEHTVCYEREVAYAFIITQGPRLGALFFY